MRFWSVLLLATVLRDGPVLAQGDGGPPAEWKQSTLILGSSLDIGRVDLPHNSTAAVRAEVLDPKLVLTIAAANDLATQDLSGLKLVQDPDSGVIQLYLRDAGQRPFNVVRDRLLSYIAGRKEGHTKEFMTAALTNRSLLHLTQPDPDLACLLIARPLLPESWVKKYASGSTTNQVTRTGNDLELKVVTNIVSRWTAFSIVDGPVGWGFYLYFNPDDTFNHLEEVRCDAIEIDPKMAPLLKQIDAQVEARMRQDRTYGSYGALRIFWRLRKEQLRTRGITWRTPAELNPNTRYD